MKVSVITVCYNSEKTVRDTIASVLNQKYKNIEYIIVDGSSTDSTLSIIDEYRERISIVISESDNGMYDAMNKGIRRCSGDVIGILNSDDFYSGPNVIASVVDCFQNNPGSDLVMGDLVFVHPKNLNQIVRYYGSKRFQPWKMRFGWMPPHPATFITKNAYALTTGYSPEFKISADYELLVRLLLVNRLKWSKLPAVLVKMRLGGLSTSGIKSSILLNNEIVKACRSNGVYTNQLFLLIKIPFKLLDLSWNNICRSAWSKVLIRFSVK